MLLRREGQLYQVLAAEFHNKLTMDSAAPLLETG